MTERLIWVSLPWATFGLVVSNGVATFAPPIAHWALGRGEHEVAAHYRKRGAEFRIAKEASRA